MTEKNKGDLPDRHIVPSAFGQDNDGSDERDMDEQAHESLRTTTTGSAEDPDDLVHSNATGDDPQDGSLPDPEELDQWENRTSGL